MSSAQEASFILSPAPLQAVPPNLLLGTGRSSLNKSRTLSVLRVSFLSVLTVSFLSVLTVSFHTVLTVSFHTVLTVSFHTVLTMSFHTFARYRKGDADCPLPDINGQPVYHNELGKPVTSLPAFSASLTHVSSAEIAATEHFVLHTPTPITQHLLTTFSHLSTYTATPTARGPDHLSLITSIPLCLPHITVYTTPPLWGTHAHSSALSASIVTPHTESPDGHPISSSSSTEIEGQVNVANRGTAQCSFGHRQPPLPETSILPGTTYNFLMFVRGLFLPRFFTSMLQLI